MAKTHHRGNVLLLAAIVAATLVTASSGRAVNISNTWMLPEEGFPVFYRYFRDRISWYEADAVCQFHHANLVTVDSTSQYDAIRAYLKELDIASNVWIGLSRNAEKPNFKWTDFRPLGGVNYWQEAIPTGKEALCAAMDPAADFRWHALACGGPSVAAFICELPVPSWATGSGGCLLTELPSLTVLYMPEQSALELTSDCGLDGMKRILCKGNANREELMHQLTCTNSHEDFDEQQQAHSTLIPVTTEEEQAETIIVTTTSHPNAIFTKTTKSWTSNTIGSNEYGLPTRHRRETEDTITPSTATKTTTAQIPNARTTEDVKEKETTEKPSEMDLVTIASSVSGTTVSTPTVTTTETKIAEEVSVQTTKKTIEEATTDETEVSSSSAVENQGELYVSSTIAGDMKAGSDLTNIDGTNGEYQGTINQGQLFSIIENGAMFDIIELNETAEENKTSKSIEATDAASTASSTESSTSLYTTVMYHKEPPGEQNAAATNDLKKSDKETSTKKGIVLTSTALPLNKDMHKQKTINDLSSKDDDKTLNKEVEMFSIPGDSMVKLNRTNRKELPMIEYMDTDETINLDLDNSINIDATKETEIDEAQLHHTVEIKIPKDGNRNETTLFVTTKHKDASFLPKKEKKSGTIELSGVTTETSTNVRIDPKLDVLNTSHNMTSTNNETEIISLLVSDVAAHIKELSSEEVLRHDHDVPLTFGKDSEEVVTEDLSDGIRSPVMHAPRGTTTEEYLDSEPENQQKPNRQRQLTRPQRRSFYPYFFSRVLG